MPRCIYDGTVILYSLHELPLVVPLVIDSYHLSHGMTKGGVHNSIHLDMNFTGRSDYQVTHQ